MGQRQPFSAADDSAWLSRLVDTMDRVEQMHDEPCDAVILSTVMARLNRPAAMRSSKPASRFELFEFAR